MSLDFSSLLPLIVSSGPAALAVAMAALVTVYLLEFTDLLPNPTAKRIAVVVLSALFSGVQGGQLQAAVIAAISTVGATLGHLAIDALNAAYQKSKTAPK